jgi:hypothetical protein
VAKNEDNPAKRAILREWDFEQKSIPKPPVFPAAFVFFQYLKNRRHDLLMDFRASGDKWKTVC